MNIKKTYLHSGVLTPIGIIIILLGYLVETLRMASIVQDGLPTQSFFPFLIFLLGFPVAIYLLFTGISDIKKENPDNTENAECLSEQSDSIKWKIKPSHKPVYMTILTFVFVILFKYLGYTLTAPLYLFFFQLIYDDQLGHYWKKAFIAILITAMVYALYVGFFNILFPEVWK